MIHEVYDTETKKMGIVKKGDKYGLSFDEFGENAEIEYYDCPDYFEKLGNSLRVLYALSRPHSTLTTHSQKCWVHTQTVELPDIDTKPPLQNPKMELQILVPKSQWNTLQSDEKSFESMFTKVSEKYATSAESTNFHLHLTWTVFSALYLKRAGRLKIYP